MTTPAATGFCLLVAIPNPGVVDSRFRAAILSFALGVPIAGTPFFSLFCFVRRRHLLHTGHTTVPRRVTAVAKESGNRGKREQRGQWGRH
jgi:hypothetical protein